jgi:hypothetical protein
LAQTLGKIDLKLTAGQCVHSHGSKNSRRSEDTGQHAWRQLGCTVRSPALNPGSRVNTCNQDDNSYSKKEITADGTAFAYTALTPAALIKA